MGWEGAGGSAPAGRGRGTAGLFHARLDCSTHPSASRGLSVRWTMLHGRPYPGLLYDFHRWPYRGISAQWSASRLARSLPACGPEPLELLRHGSGEDDAVERRLVASSLASSA